MSQENLDLVVRAIQAALKQPKPDFETVNALYDPDHVYVPLAANVLQGELKGAVDVGPDKVLVVTRPDSRVRRVG